MTDNSSALKIDPFDSVEIELSEEVHAYRSGMTSKNQVLETIKRIDKLPFHNFNIRYSDNSWDFFSATDLPVSHYQLFFQFDPDSSFCNLEKSFVLNEIIKKTTKIRVLRDKYGTIRGFLNYCEAKGFIDLSTIPKTVVQEYFDTEKGSCSYSTVCSYKSHILALYNFYERTFHDISDPSIKKYLSKRNTSKCNNIKAANKTPEIPVNYFPVFLDGVKSIMRDSSESDDDRITAACIILYSQIGFRTGELFTVKSNSLHSEYSPKSDKPLLYMDFLSYKHGNGESDGTLAHTYMNDLSVEAYQLLMSVCEPYRVKINSDKLVVFPMQINPIASSQTTSTKFRVFCMRHWMVLKCLNIDEYSDSLSFFEAGFFLDKQDRKGYDQYDKTAEWAKSLKSEDRIYYPTIRQFRVSVCTSLYRQQIPLHYIRKHMNHLTEDMAAYYIRPQKNIEKQYSETVYRAVFKDGSKLLGANSDAFIQKINDFITENHYNIQDNTDAVIDSIAKRFPLRSKLGGMCIRCGEVIPCASNTATDVIYCAFGMCPNHCHMFFMADISFEEYLNHKEIVQYNHDNGFKKAYQKELHKLIYHAENSLLPELLALEEELEKHGSENILEKYPQLTYIVHHFNEIKEEVMSWTKKTP